MLPDAGKAPASLSAELLRRAEEAARARQCLGVYIDTFEPQVAVGEPLPPRRRQDPFGAGLRAEGIVAGKDYGEVLHPDPPEVFAGTS